MLPTRTIDESARAIRSGKLTPLALVETCLAQIKEHDAKLRAWAIVDERGARQKADELAIPIGIKDIVDVRGLPTRAGAAVRRDQPPAERDAYVAARLRAAGAIILGKTVTTEFASFDPPPTRNPWNPERTPGGSSSGSAVAVATGMCLGAIGSQTGGSITRPASFCGVASCKATFGRVSRQGVVPVSYNVDHVGPMARSVADLAILLGAIAGYDEHDAQSVRRPVPDYRAALEKLAPPRLGLIEAFFMEKAEPRVVAVVRAALDRLHRDGAAIDTAGLPSGFDEMHQMHRWVATVDAAEYHREMFSQHSELYGREISAFIRDGLALSPHDYQRARGHQDHFRRAAARAVGDFDALVTPATTQTAPDPSTTGDPQFNSPWSYSGLPTVSIPCGLADDGLPVALQLIGRPFEESQLFGVAAWCERQLKFTATPF
jgi:aspartyl-tRNA(Asn)/glutamyl-tRNA(Gln) amidotransferase subunit A